jgi:hypothetical protein
MAEQQFIDRIIQGFETMRERPHLNFLAEQFAAGEIMFIVDRRGIRITTREETEENYPVSLD